MEAKLRVSTTLRRGVSPPVGPGKAEDRFRTAFSTDARVEGPFRIKHPDGKVGKELSRADAVKRLDAILPKVPIGSRVRVLSANGEAFKLHAVDAAPRPATDIPGVPNVRQWAGIVEATWPHARFAGSCVCKPDSGPSCNGHCDCAAIDYFDTWPHMDAMVRRAIRDSRKLGVSYAILRDKIWVYGAPRTSSSKGWYPYTGDYHYHVHLSFTGGICKVACKPSDQWPRA